MTYKFDSQEVRNFYAENGLTRTYGRYGKSNAVKKVIKRVDDSKPVPTVREWLHSLISKKMSTWAQYLPDSDYSMGDFKTIELNLGKYKITGNYDNTREYARSCKWRARHGYIKLSLSKDQYLNTEIIGGIVTIFKSRNDKKSRIRKCYVPEIDHFPFVDFKASAILESTYFCTKTRYHGTKEGCISSLNKQKFDKMEEQSFKKYMRKKYTRQDSIDAGNCPRGTDLFIARSRMDALKRYTGKEIWQHAEKQNVKEFALRMFRYENFTNKK